VVQNKQEECFVFCKNCGSQIADNVKFCTSCGVAVQNAPQLTTTNTPRYAPSPTSNRKNGLIAGVVIMAVVVIGAIAMSRIISNKHAESAALSAAAINRYNKQGGGQGGYDNAITEFTNAINLDSSNAQAYHNRGVLYRDKGEYDSAVSDFNRAVTLDPNNGAVFFSRGKTYLAQGNYDQAIADFSKAIELGLKNESNESNISLFYCKRGESYMAQGGYDRAMADLNKAIELYRGNGLAYALRAEIYFQAGQRTQAIEDLEKAIPPPPPTFPLPEIKDDVESYSVRASGVETRLKEIRGW
jgi:tetratricopeptide (TPR) repeat protein